MQRFNTSSTPKLFNCIVVIGYVWPEPNSSAAGSRMMQLLHFFNAQSQRVIFASPALLSEHREPLAKVGIEEQSIELNNQSFDRWIKEINPDVTIFDRFMMEEQFGWRVEQQCPQSIRILNTEDLHSLRHSRQLNLKKALACNIEFDQYFNDQSLLYEAMQQQDICQREIASIYRSDLSLMISSFEVDLLIQKFQVPEHILLHLPFMLSPSQKEETTPLSFEEREHFVTIGNFRHEPNWDSVLWLKQAIWPKIRKHLPKAELHIYGAYPAKKVTDLHKPKDGFYIDGWANDALDVLARARICLAPLRFGAGIKGKFTDAMQVSTPSITTDVGAEAMTENFDWPGRIANTSKKIAEQAVELYLSENAWKQASDLSHEIIYNCYNEEKLSVQLQERLDTLKHNLTSLRAENFTGTMLRHHHHKSTKYMAQWIEAKNK